MNGETDFLRIEPAGHWTSLNVAELWKYRELLYFLIWRDVKVKYKETVIGAAWVLVQPILMMLAFTLFFGILVRVPSDDLPYPVFFFSGLVPWSLFSYAMLTSSNSLIMGENLIKRIYFPRALLPLSAVLGGLVDFVGSFTVLVLAMLVYGIVPGRTLVALPIFVIMTVATALGAGLWLSALSLRFRDVRNTLNLLAQLWLFCTPVIYPSSLVPPHYQFLYGLNPMAGAIEGFRWSLLGRSFPSSDLLTASCFSVTLLLTSGVLYFQRAEKKFADLV